MASYELTQPQLRLLRAVVATGGPCSVSGNQYRVAKALERMGLVRVQVGGSGVAYQGTWWWEAVATAEGLRLPVAGGNVPTAGTVGG